MVPPVVASASAAPGGEEVVLGGGEMDMEIEDDKGPTGSTDQQQNGEEDGERRGGRE